ncbi:hypothetical protein BBJ28_00011759 [Nothophytophthora sp. Chile5]|nr:hypothetical protein BBJ28_00011759 [Nothophytophthora sp. Chile5]
MEQHGKQGKSQRKRLQRQLEFYLSDSNLRQDKFLQQAMDDQGFVPTLNATERMILDVAEKSTSIRTDRARSCIAPETLPTPDQDHETADLRTVYIDSVGKEDDHDSLRRTFSKFGKVNLVSLPRFQQSKRFKGFGFVEFAEQSAAVETVKAARSLDTDLRGIRVMSKVRWLEMKEQLKLQLSTTPAGAFETATKEGGEQKDGTAISSKKMERNLAKSSERMLGEKKQRRRKPSAGGHIHFSDDEDGEDEETPMHDQQEEAAETHQEQRAKKQKV